MTKIDYFNDIHLDIWFLRNRLGFCSNNIGHIDELKDKLVGWINDRKSDAKIVSYAGDSGNGWKWHTIVIDALSECYEIVLHTPGNHDFYHDGGYLRDHYVSREVEGIGRVVSCPLWTNFRVNYGKEAQEKNGLYAESDISDFFKIPEISGPYVSPGARWKTVALENERYWRKLVAEENVKIAITHFPPIIQSEDPKYAGDPANAYFVNDDAVRFNRVNAVAWFHGHTHTAFDYMEGSTRVLAWPIGYPTENFNYLDDAPIKTVELDL